VEEIEHWMGKDVGKAISAFAYQEKGYALIPVN
jgi:hypothetical protein